MLFKKALLEGVDKIRYTEQKKETHINFNGKFSYCENWPNKLLN